MKYTLNFQLIRLVIYRITIGRFGASLIAQLVGKESACNAGDPGLIPGLRQFPEEGNGNPLQYSCLENPMDRGAWKATVDRVTRVGRDLVTKPPHR